MKQENRHRKERELEKDRIARKIEKYTDKAEWLKNKGTSKALDKLEEVETTIDIMRKETELWSTRWLWRWRGIGCNGSKEAIFDAEQVERDVLIPGHQ